MYQPHSIVLMTDIRKDDKRSVCVPLSSNGTYIRTDRGNIVGREGSGPNSLFFIGWFLGEKFSGYITDQLLVERIEEYLYEYFGQYHTNCATFAHFLTTGQFQECCEQEWHLVLEHGMRPFEMDSRVRVGDQVCILYANKRVARSRHHGFGHKYRQIQRRRHRTGCFTASAELGLQKRVYSPEEIRWAYQGFRADDFHFMVCVAKVDGQPVWLSQLGRMRSDDEPVAFALTPGYTDPYVSKVPLVTLIKKRR